MEASDAVDHAIRSRRTAKVLAPAPLPARDRRAVVDEVMAVAGWAPFHRPAADAHRGALAAPVPWRFHALDAAGCRALAAWLGEGAGKVQQMLHAADALVQATWLPDLPADGAAPAGLFDPTERNMEHVAAAGAAVQSLLLAATARGFATYWSSGGALRRPETFERLGIPAGEVLLGSVFLFPDAPGDAETVYSKLRETRGEAAGWARWVEL